MGRIFKAIREGAAEYSSWEKSSRRQTCLPEWDTFHHFDNFATRTLSGDYMVPAGMMELKHLEKAKSRLRDMDVVLILEELAVHSVQLEVTFKWKDASEIATHKANAHDKQKLAKVFNQTEEEFLRAHNQLDYQLYEYARSLAANLTAAASSW